MMMEEERSYIKVMSVRKIYDLLTLIQKNPAMWLTSKSITTLQNFLNGYMVLGFADDIYRQGQPTLKEFEHWILNKETSNAAGNMNIFSTVLLSACRGDEAWAFDRFFECLDEFLKEKQ